MERLKVGVQFSGVGAFDQALKDLNIPFYNIYQAEWDKYARTTYLANHGEPEFYVEDVHDTPVEEIFQKFGSLDVFMSSAPCQAFSISGKRQGKNDEKGRGILFFQSLEFIRVNKPRFFIFENVKGLLSDDKKNKKDSLGRTFNEWINYLGGKSVNGNEVMFPYEGSVPYHIYWDVLNAKEHGIPQNRERVFIVGIRDDKDNNFQFPKEEPLKHRIKDYLETFENSPYKFKTQEEFDAYMEKYYLSDKMLKYFENRADNFNGGKVNIRDKDSYATSITASSKSVDISDNFIKDDVRIGTWRTHEDGKGFREMEDGNCPTIPARAREDGSGQPVIKQSVVDANGLNSSECVGNISATYGKGVENYGSRPFIKETTEMKQEAPKVKQINTSKESGGVQPYQQNRVYDTDGIIPSLMSELGGERSYNILTKETKECEENQNWIRGGLQENQPLQYNGITPCLTSAMGMGGGQIPVHNYNERIRRLTPTEAFRFMNFPDSIVVNAKNAGVSESQLYKQAGNSIVVRVLAKIIKNLLKNDTGRVCE